jgi:hypothetical protein
MRLMKGILSVGIAGCFVAASACDSVQSTGGDGAEDGLLVDGTSSGTAHVYDRYTGTDGSAISVGNYDTGGGDVVAFTVGHAPTLQPTATWTSSPDHMTLAFDPKFKVKFQNWIVQGPFGDGMSHAINACIRTSQIWHDERQGTAFSAFGVTDATADPQATTYTAFDCGKAAAIKTDIGFDANAINVYWVNTVDFGDGMPLTSNGVTCGGNVVAMGANVLDHLFTHEIGHAFDLAHTNPIPAFFDVTNVMHNASNNRSFLTEGQTFRAVTDPVSAVNTLGGRTGIMRAACGSISGSAVSISTTDPLCPAIQKRVWADGAAWPAN